MAQFGKKLTKLIKKKKFVGYDYSLAAQTTSCE